jgi:hypothetical protein
MSCSRTAYQWSASDPKRTSRHEVMAMIRSHSTLTHRQVSKSAELPRLASPPR